METTMEAVFYHTHPALISVKGLDIKELAKVWHVGSMCGNAGSLQHCPWEAPGITNSRYTV